MIRSHHCALALAISASLGHSVAMAQSNATASQDSAAGEIESTYVYGEPGTTKTATKLNLSVFETPQMVTVISRDQIDDFNLRQVNTLLSYVPGVTVEQVETGRTYYTARGFDIVNFQYDGVGVPFSYGLTQGHDDTATYEKVEVVKGATGLTTGLANPSATINYVRKRPTETLQASAAASAGSWSQLRLEGDISGPIAGDALKGRLVVAKQDGDSYLDRFGKELTVFYGIVDGDITDSTRWALGYSLNDNHNDANSSGALPLFYNDGSVTDYDVSTNTAPEWAGQEVKQQRTFVELEQDLGENWVAKAIYTQNRQDKEWESFYLSGSPDPITEEGLVGVASFYEAEDDEDILDLFVSGTFALWGQQHDLVAGLNMAKISLTGRSVYSSEWSGYDDPVGGDWAESNTPQPSYDIYNADFQSTDIEQDQDSFYLSTRLRITDRVAVLLGARQVELDQTGISYGAPQDVADSETVPYAGLTIEVLDGTMLYGSYSEVFKQQTWVDAELAPLGPVKGESTELGVKQELFDGKSVLTIALFSSAQDNFGEWVTRDIETGLNIYRGEAFDSNGYEIELAGELIEGLNLSAGYTEVEVEDSEGNATRRFIPQQQFKLATAYQIPSLPELRLGAGVNWQSELYYGETEVQGSYTLLDLFVQYDLPANVTLALNINNVTDTQYRLSPQWGQANYGAPRNVMGTVSWSF